MGYTRNEIIALCNEWITPDKVKDLYKQDFINYRGKTKDTKELYTEVIASFILDHLDCFNNIKTISRNGTYNPKHNGLYVTTSNREEEKIAMDLYVNKNKQEYSFGKVLNYQVPLKNTRNDIGIGKIDLLSYSGNIVYILELKRPNSKETMLRCVLEAYTYLLTVDKIRLLKDYNLPEDSIIKAASLTFEEGCQQIEYNDEENHPFLKVLMKQLDCKAFFLIQTITSK